MTDPVRKVFDKIDSCDNAAAEAAGLGEPAPLCCYSGASCVGRIEFSSKNVDYDRNGWVVGDEIVIQLAPSCSKNVEGLVGGVLLVEYDQQNQGSGATTVGRGSVWDSAGRKVCPPS